MAELVPTTRFLYELQYCPERDEYFDHPPVRKSERSVIEWFCPCKCNSKFTTYGDWMRHINLKVHKDYKENYKFLNKSLLDERNVVKDLKRENHQLGVKHMGLKKKYKNVKKGLKDQNELENNIQKLKAENQELNQKINDLEKEYITSDSDDDFEDCR